MVDRVDDNGNEVLRGVAELNAVLNKYQLLVKTTESVDLIEDIKTDFRAIRLSLDSLCNELKKTHFMFQEVSVINLEE